MHASVHARPDSQLFSVSESLKSDPLDSLKAKQNSVFLRQ